MRWNFLILGLLLYGTGCASWRGNNPKDPFSTTVNAPRPSPERVPQESPATSPTIVTPADPMVGRVASVNSSARFVVLTYSIGNLPAAERRLSVYRNGLKVAELKVTGPSQDINTVADILAGECQVGDEVREN